MSGFNMPQGVSPADIPGNEAEARIRRRHRCLITGCALRERAGSPLYYWGDLHIVGESFVFVSNHELFHEDNELHNTARAVTFEPDTPRYGARGVWIFPADTSLLSVQALAYIGEGEL